MGEAEEKPEATPSDSVNQCGGNVASAWGGGGGGGGGVTRHMTGYKTMSKKKASKGYVFQTWALSMFFLKKVVVVFFLLCIALLGYHATEISEALNQNTITLLGYHIVSTITIKYTI